MVKSFIKNSVKKLLSNYYNSINYLSSSTARIQYYRNKIYSYKYCIKINCKNVSFKKDINSIVGEKYIEIGSGTRFGRQVVLTAWDAYEDQKFYPSVLIGMNCNFGDYLHLTCINKIVIGNGVLTGRWVTISDNSHGETNYDSLQIPPVQRKLISKGVVYIGNNVWVGDKATILSGIKIGDGSVIAANAVVTKDIPPYSVAAGNPAKVIKTYTK